MSLYEMPNLSIHYLLYSALEKRRLSGQSADSETRVSDNEQTVALLVGFNSNEPQGPLKHCLVNPVSSVNHISLFMVEIDWQLKRVVHSNMRMKASPSGCGNVLLYQNSRTNKASGVRRVYYFVSAKQYDIASQFKGVKH